jgi:DNA-binding winged helix-turn-helix (wHTH) protein
LEARALMEAHEVQCGPFRVDLRNECVGYGAETLHLRPKTFAVWRYLVAHAGRLVTKEELLATVWPETVVHEAALNICISQLRRVLGDDPQVPRFIETVHRRGYRFIAALTVADPPVTVPEATTAMGTRPLAVPPTLFKPALLVGREREVQRLHGWLEQAQHGVRQVVFVAGEPGIGKTTVVDTFTASLAAEANLWVAGGSVLTIMGWAKPTYRLDGCNPEEQRLLEASSVAGAEFSAAAVAAGVEAAVEEVEERYAVLARRGQLVQARGLEEWPDGTISGCYGFLHALYQQVVYDRLPVGRRVRLHRRIGEREETAYGVRAAEHAAKLAMHFDHGRDYSRSAPYRRQEDSTALRQIDDDIAIGVEHRLGLGWHHAGGVVLLDDARSFAWRGELGAMQHRRRKPADLRPKICLARRQGTACIAPSGQEPVGDAWALGDTQANDLNIDDLHRLLRAAAMAIRTLVLLPKRLS